MFVGSRSSVSCGARGVSASQRKPAPRLASQFRESGRVRLPGPGTPLCRSVSEQVAASSDGAINAC